MLSRISECYATRTRKRDFLMWLVMTHKPCNNLTSCNKTLKCKIINIKIMHFIYHFPALENHYKMSEISWKQRQADQCGLLKSNPAISVPRIIVLLCAAAAKLELLQPVRIFLNSCRIVWVTVTLCHSYYLSISSVTVCACIVECSTCHTTL